MSSTPSTPATNRQILLVDRPQGPLAHEHFRAATAPMPALADGEVLCRTILLSIDPANRARMQGRTYRDQLGEGDVMSGFSLAEVVSGPPGGPPPGSVVSAVGGWQEYFALPASAVRPITPAGPLTNHLGVLGITGLTAYFGLVEVARPAAGETVLVSAAAGATGSVVVQIAKALGCRVVGIAGSDAKLAFLRDELGADAAVSHRSATLREELKAACPDGVDVYFDNVGGPLLGHALTRMNVHGRIACCGVVSQYDRAEPEPGPRGVPGLVVVKRLRMEGFLLDDFEDRWPEAEARLADWVVGGEVRAYEDVLDGLDRAPEALIGLLAGDNVGKRMVRVGPDPG
jgi:NADPH-dependent curcumin reductase CurA